jgi:predicted transcriptional regulator of viral defense system
MTFHELLQSVGRHGWFDLATLVQISGESRDTLRVQLYRWRKAGKLLSLRRGMYAFADAYRRAEIQPAELANRIYAPSYLSLQWALSYHGLIPEMTVVFTAVTTRQTKRFRNEFGTFRYRHLNRAFFFGYERVAMGDRAVLLATPEKALLDLWHLESGEWTVDRMREMRFQSFDIIDMERLAHFAEKAGAPRLDRAARSFSELASEETEGTVEG